jgi:hypothetical protein
MVYLIIHGNNMTIIYFADMHYSIMGAYLLSGR